MAHPDSVSPSVAQRATDEIKSFARLGMPTGFTVGPDISPGLPEPNLQATEPLAVWKLKPGSLQKLAEADLTEDISTWVEPTDALYHDIVLDGRPVGFARSTNSDTGKVVSQINLSATSHRAVRVREALKVSEHHGDDSVLKSDPVVRLLEIPAAHVSALWLFAEGHGESRLIVISSAKRYAGLRPNQLMTSRQFLEALKEGGSIHGVA